MPGNMVEPMEKVVAPAAGTAEKAGSRVGWNVFLCIFVFVLCVAPTILSYKSYLFRWDDSDYLSRSINLSRAFWAGDAHGVRIAMVDIRPPIMMLLGVPWGPVASWSAAGKCFVTLIALTAIFAAFCLFALLRAGIKPLYLAIAGVAVFAALGPYTSAPYVHLDATSFMADMLFAWIIFAVLLLIPYEGVTHDLSPRGAVLRGMLWGVLFSAAAITKLTCGYFLVLTAPILLFIRMRNSGSRSARIALAATAVTCAPVGIYWLRYGLPALRSAWNSSFGGMASFYNVSLWSFARYALSTGMMLWLACVIAGLAYWAARRREHLNPGGDTVGGLGGGSGARVLPLLIVLGYAAISLASSNREIRFLFSAMIAPPFLVALLLSGKKDAVAFRPAALAAGCAFAIE
jgi:hypothetical protein